MSICNYTSQINEIVRQLSQYDALEQLNELKDIKNTIDYQKSIQKCLNEQIRISTN